MPAKRTDLLQRVARNIAEARKDLGITQDAFAARLDISTKNVQRLESGAQNLTLKTIEKIAKALRASPESFFATSATLESHFARPFARLENAGFRVRSATNVGRRPKGATPIVDLRAAAGSFRASRAVETIGWVVGGMKVLRDESHFVAQILGNSMMPTVANGAFALFRKTTRRPTPGRLYLFEQRVASDDDLAGSHALKRFDSAKKLSNGSVRVTLKSDNALYPTLVIKLDDLSELKVVAEFVQVVA